MPWACQLSTLWPDFFFSPPLPTQWFYNWEVVKQKWITRRAKLLSDRENSWKEQSSSEWKFSWERSPKRSWFWHGIRCVSMFCRTPAPTAATERLNGELYQSFWTWRFWVLTATWEGTSLPRPRRSGGGPPCIPPSRTDLHRHAGSEKLGEWKKQRKRNVKWSEKKRKKKKGSGLTKMWCQKLVTHCCHYWIIIIITIIITFSLDVSLLLLNCV